MVIQKKLNKKILLCATDAGGIGNLAPLVPVLTSRGLNPVVLTTKERLPLWGSKINGSLELILANELNANDLSNLLTERRPHRIICGTTCYSSPDRTLIQLSRAANIPSVVVLDEWYDYRFRFVEPNTDELSYLPDAIALQDEQAKKGAVNEDIPAEICRVTGSPALAGLTECARSFLKTPPIKPDFLEGISEIPMVTFLSQTFMVDYGTRPGSTGLLGSFVGYTEDSVREEILRVLSELGCRVCFVEKLHPAARKKDSSLNVPENILYHVTQDTQTWALLWYSQLIIGMRSLALLEAKILGCDAVSYQPNLIGAERCTAVRLGVLPKLSRKSELKSWLKMRLNGSPLSQDRRINEYPFATPEAAKNVVDLAIN